MNGLGGPSLNDLFRAAADAWFSKFYGPMPGQVESYDFNKQVADVQPLLMIYVHGTLTKLEILRSVPVRWPSGGDFAVTFPLQKGNPVGIEPQGADASGWIASGSPGQPVPTQRRFSLSGVFCVPGGRSIANPLPSSCVHESYPVISGNPLLLGDSSASEFVALAQKVLDELNAHRTWDAAHVHLDPVSGQTSTPTVAPPEHSSVAATKVKAK